MKENSAAARLISLLRTGSLRLSCAESCTGGRFAKEIVDVPGASAVFVGGVVCYDTAVKTELLGVSPDDVARYGVVSAPVAQAMAEGVRRLLHTDLAVSVTGLAGPDGGSEAIPVGRVYIGLAWEGGASAYKCDFPGDRTDVRRAATEKMMQVLTDYIGGKKTYENI